MLQEKCKMILKILNKSIDIRDRSQLAIFVRYIYSDINVKQDMLDLATLKRKYLVAKTW